MLLAVLEWEKLFQDWPLVKGLGVQSLWALTGVSVQDWGSESAEVVRMQDGIAPGSQRNLLWILAVKCVSDYVRSLFSTWYYRGLIVSEEA